jgi:hypothetical protein
MIIDYRTLFEPIREFYVPSGWHIRKNHLFNINEKGFLKIENKNDQWLAKDFFINECIFLSGQEYPLSTTEVISGVVDIECKLINEKKFELKYNINLSVSLKKKNKAIEILSLEETTDNPNRAASIASNFMKSFSHEELVDFKTGRPKTEEP